MRDVLQQIRIEMALAMVRVVSKRIRRVAAEPNRVPEEVWLNWSARLKAASEFLEKVVNEEIESNVP